MRSIDALGVFWSPNHSDEVLTGRLRFDPEEDGGAVLDIVTDVKGRGAFDHDRKVRLLGVFDKHEVTLEDCQPGRSNWTSTGMVYRRFHVGSLLIGHHFDDSTESLEFDEVLVELSDLPEWVGITGLTEHWDHAPGADPLYQLNFTEPSALEHNFSQGSLAVTFRWRSDGDHVSAATFKQWPRLRIRYAQHRHLASVLSDVRHLQDLLTLCVDRRVSADFIVLRNSTIPARSISGEAFPFAQDVEYLAQPLRPARPSDRRPLSTSRMFLTFEHIGGMATIAQWLDVASSFHRAVASLMSVQHARQIYTENRLLNVAYAAEAFHRDKYASTYMPSRELDDLVEACLRIVPTEHHKWLQAKLHYGNAPTLYQRLHELASSNESAVKPLIGRRKRWARIVAGVRNELTHLSSQRKQFEGPDLYMLSESVYAVLRVSMLREAGVPESVLIERMSSEHALWYRDRLRSSVSRAYLTLYPSSNDDSQE